MLLAHGNAEEVELWLSMLIADTETGKLAVVKSWVEGQSSCPGGFSFVRSPHEWRVLHHAFRNWTAAGGIVLPAENDGALPPVAAISDPERRLARLRELGGDAKKVRDEWKFSGMVKLVASEKALGRKRSDDKTIRADLKEAAEAEREAKAAGHFDGLKTR